MRDLVRLPARTHQEKLREPCTGVDRQFSGGKVGEEGDGRVGQSIGRSQIVSLQTYFDQPTIDLTRGGTDNKEFERYAFFEGVPNGLSPLIKELLFKDGFILDRCPISTRWNTLGI